MLQIGSVHLTDEKKIKKVNIIILRMCLDVEFLIMWSTWEEKKLGYHGNTYI